MSKKKSQEEYENEVKIINPNIKVIENYKGNKYSILHKCKIDGYEWYALPSNILRGHGCPKCYGNISYTQEEYIAKVYKINPNIQVLGRYIKNNISILHKCLIDNYEWMAKPNNILNGTGCPKCAGTIKKSQEEYISQVNKVNRMIKVLGEYVNQNTKISHQCLKCNHIWEATPSNILSGRGCPVCHESKGEKKCKEIFDKYNIKYISQYTFNDLIGDYNILLKFDFGILNNNNELQILIEYDGDFHFRKVYKTQKFELQQKYDKMKNQYCKYHNIKLIRISYLDFDKIEDIILSLKEGEKICE